MSDAGTGGSRFALWAFLAWIGVTVLWWALAFAPLPAPAVWLAEARTVCFGTLPNGLPDGWGWVSLIGSPLAMLGFLLAVWWRDLERELGRLAASPAGRGVLALLLAIPLAGGWWLSGRLVAARTVDRAAAGVPATEPAELPAGYPRGTLPAPPLGLLDQSGEPLELASLRGRPVVVTFAFAHCRTVCPAVVRTVRAAAEELGDLQPAVLVVTLDPWRDRPSALPGMLRAWDLEDLAFAHVLSGEVDSVLEVLAAWQMPVERNPADGDIVHPVLVHVVAPDGTLAYSFNNPPVGWVVEGVRRVA